MNLILTGKGIHFVDEPANRGLETNNWPESAYMSRSDASLRCILLSRKLCCHAFPTSFGTLPLAGRQLIIAFGFRLSKLIMRLHGKAAPLPVIKGKDAALLNITFKFSEQIRYT